MACARSALITGSNRGLGLQFAKQLANNSGYRHVFAACRNPDKAPELLSLAGENPKIQVLQLDVQNDQEIQSAVEVVNKNVGDDGLNLFINNAGISINGGPIRMVNRNDFMKTIDINVLSPIMLTKAFYRLLRVAAKNGNSSSWPVVVNLSSILGSIESNDTGSLFPYRCSKSALNMATKSMAIEFAKKDIIAIAMHPGWVLTDLGGPKAPLIPKDSVEGMLEVIEKLDASDSGKFFTYDGKHLPW